MKYESGVCVPLNNWVESIDICIKAEKVVNLLGTECVDPSENDGYQVVNGRVVCAEGYALDLEVTKCISTKH